MNLDFLKIVKDKNVKDWQGIVLHHSATADGMLNDWEGIKRYHMSFRYDGRIISKDKALLFEAECVKGIEHPWQDVGYHFGIETIGLGVEIFKGRPLTLSGAHAKDFNQTHIGICVIGNYDKGAPDSEHWSASLELVRFLLMEFSFTKYDVIGHRETYALRGVAVEKSCPGKFWDMEKFREEI